VVQAICHGVYMQFTPRVCGGIVEGLPRMIIELNRGTPAPVRLSIPSNRAAPKGLQRD